MSGTKYAPARLSMAEQARIQKALEEASRVNEIIAEAAAAISRCRATTAALDAASRRRLADAVERAEQACARIDAARHDLAQDVQRVQDEINRALASRNARALPSMSDRFKGPADDLGDQTRVLDDQTHRIEHLAEDIAGDEAAAERCRAARRKNGLKALVEQLQSRIATDPSFRWVGQDARQAVADGEHALRGDVSEDACRSFERQLEHLRAAAFDAERHYHERRRSAELVCQVFREFGFEVTRAADAPHGSTGDIANTFTPTDEHLLVTIGTRHPWALDDDRRQILHLTMTARSRGEETTDEVCVERLKDFAQRARELGIEIGDVLQPLPGGGYQCVLTADSEERRTKNEGRRTGTRN
jgi:hypothetical protein